MAAYVEYFRYLDDLRASGKINMFGAGPHLQNSFGLEQSVARDICDKWRKTFNQTQTATERAAQVSK